MRRMIWISILLILATAGCKQEPKVAGVSLECTSDDTCVGIAGDWRCFAGICIKNAPPILDPLSTDFVLPGTPVSKAVTFTDEEGDTATVTWTAVSPPALALLPTPHEGSSLELLPPDLGLYTFSVIAADAYSAGPAVTYTIVVQPSSNAIYVSTLGDDAGECGSFDAPCATVARGVQRLAGSGGSDILVAAQAGSRPYNECLDIGGATRVLGCFDPLTWERDLGILPLCRLECHESSGHRIAGSATVEQLTLAMSAGVAPPQDDPPRDLPLVTVWVRDGAPTLDSIDVEAAACGAGCATVGLGSLNASPALSGIDVAARVDAFDPAVMFVGMLLAGGAPEIDAGTPGRGNIFLNLPSTEAAGGILALESAATIHGVTVRGGPATQLFGIVVFDGAVSLEASSIELTGFGSRELAGLLVGSCDDAGADELCQCTMWLSTDECSTLQIEQPALPSVTVLDNDIELGGVPGESGLAPCTGVGMLADISVLAAQIEGNTITVGDDMPLSIGMGVQGREGSVVATLAHSISNNAITVGDARVRDICFIAGGGDIFADLDITSFGMLVGGTVGVTIADNTINVGANEWVSVGLSVLESAATTIDGNTITAGQSHSGIRPFFVLGAAVGATATNETSYLRRNDIRVADLELGSDGLPVGGAASGIALELKLLSDPTRPRFPTWEVSNNFINGGRVVHGTGLSVYTDMPDTSAPLIRHNTISGGGHPEFGATSVAFDFFSIDPDLIGDPSDPGHQAATIESNLFDPGDARGLRQVLNNRGFGLMTASHSGVKNNIGQFVGTIDGPMPTLAIADRSFSSPINAGAAWYILLGGAGTVMHLTRNNLGQLDYDLTGDTLGRAMLDQRGRPIAWVGIADGTPTAAVVIPHAIALARLAGSQIEFTPYSTTSLGDGVAESAYRYPCAIALTDIDGKPPDDIVFAEGPGCAPPAVSGSVDGDVWVMHGRRIQEGGGYAPPRLHTSGLDDPSILVPLGRRSVVVADGNTIAIINADGADPYELPAGTEVLDLVVTTLDPSADAANDPDRDVVVVTTAGASVHLGVRVSADLEAGVPFEQPLCVGSSPTKAAAGDLEPGTDIEVLFACANGSVDLYTYDAANTRLNSIGTIVDGPGAPIAGLAVGGSSDGAGVARGSLLITRSQQIEDCAYNPVTNKCSLQSPSLLVDTAMLWFWSPEPDFPIDFGFELATGTDTCPLAYRQIGGAAYDLHLSGAGNACVDPAGLPHLTEDDIDGCDARVGVDPDIGADEWGQVGVACDGGA